MRLNPYQLAAREQKRSQRLRLAELTRLRQAAGPGEDDVPVAIDLVFARDGQGDCHVLGKASVTISVKCGNCAERMPCTLEADVDYRLVRNEARASERARSLDVMHCPDDEIELADLVEDDLLLIVPDVPCGLDSDCPNRSAIRPEAGSEAGARAEDGSPFAVLAALKGGTEQTDD